MVLDDTIVAISTPPGRGGIGIVRLSGPQARAFSEPMMKLSRPLEPGRAVVGELIEPQGQRIDEIVVTYFAKPNSYTTDDIVEIAAHGSPVVLKHIVELTLAKGARLAEPGEFTMRAFLNGRIDLTQAEAVGDLIESQTLYQAKIAAQQLEGAVSKRLQPTKKKLIELIALMEAGVDFADDDVPVLETSIILQKIAEVREDLTRLLSSFAYGKLVHEGLTLAIVGRPNVGKSSLFNRLVERERAIVTATPGTTRDLVSETVSIGGIPVKLIDTAGIRRALDEAEKIGIQKSMEALADADLVLVVMEAGTSHPEDGELLRQVEQRPAIVIRNKSDLAKAITDSTIAETFLRTSALTGEGISDLRSEILKHVGGERTSAAEAAFLTNIRQANLVDQATKSLDAAKAGAEGSFPHEMILLDLYIGLRNLDEITGGTTAEDILSLIFGRFCIGK